MKRRQKAAVDRNGDEIICSQLTYISFHQWSDAGGSTIHSRILTFLYIAYSPVLLVAEIQYFTQALWLPPATAYFATIQFTIQNRVLHAQSNRSNKIIFTHFIPFSL